MHGLWRLADTWQRIARRLRDEGRERAAGTARSLWRAAWDRAADGEAKAEAVGLATSGRVL